MWKFAKKNILKERCIYFPSLQPKQLSPSATEKTQLLRSILINVISCLEDSTYLQRLYCREKECKSCCSDVFFSLLFIRYCTLYEQCVIGKLLLFWLMEQRRNYVIFRCQWTQNYELTSQLVPQGAKVFLENHLIYQH